ncbi:MAG: PKD domain-containing protein, partial [Elusimicrobiota bacterium]
NGTYTVTLTVTDDDAGADTKTFSVTVTNVNPALTATAPKTIAEGATLNIADIGTFSDPGFDNPINPLGASVETFTYRIDWGDGTSADAGDATVDIAGDRGLATAGSFDGSHIYADNGTYTVTLMVTDDDAGADTKAFSVTVTNVNPTLTATAPKTIEEGVELSLTDIGTFTDPGFDNPAMGTVETFTYVIDWGDVTPTDGGAATVDTLGARGSATAGSFDGSHTYADNGVYTVTLTVTDDDGGTDTETFAVTVENVAPTVDAGVDQTVSEGYVVSLPPSTFNDLGTSDTHTATINWGDGTATEAGAVTETPFGPPGSTAGADGTVDGSHVYADNGVYTVTVTVTDDEGAATPDTLTVTVENVAPTVSAGADNTAAGDGWLRIGGAIDLRTMVVRYPDQPGTFPIPIGPDGSSESPQVIADFIRFHDMGTADTHTATIDWGDGSIEPVAPEDIDQTPFGPPGSTAGSSATVAGIHQYTANKVYVLLATLTDDEGASGSDSLLVTVDVEPPVTSIAHTGSSSTIAGVPMEVEVFLDQGAMNSLSAVDEAIEDIAFDVQWTFYRDVTIDGAEAPFIRQNIAHDVLPFNLTQEGIHRLEYFSVDNRGNEEGYRLGPVQEGHKFITIGVDHTASSVSLHIGEPVRYEFGQMFIAPETPLSLSAFDLEVNGVSSGVKEIQYHIDGGATIQYLAPFFIAEGTHTVTYWSVDQVNNTEEEETMLVNCAAVMGKKATGGAGKKKSVDLGGTIDFAGRLMSNGPVSLQGNVVVDGDAWGPSFAINDNSVITGSTTIMENPLHPEPFDLVAVREHVVAHDLTQDPNNPIVEHIDKKGVLSITEATLILPAGDYLLKGIRMTGGNLIIEGEVGILVEGDIKISGGNINAGAEIPQNLMIFNNQEADIEFGGNMRLAAIVYAPDAVTTFGGGAQFGGRLFTGHLTMNGSSIMLANTAPEPLGEIKPASASGPSLSPEGADQAFTLRDLYVFPNPAVGGAKPTIHLAVGIADKVTIRIYNIAGQQVHQATMDSAPPVINDGSGPKYAYEYPWDGHIPSGVYLYTIVAEKSGEAAIRKAGKFAVIR